MRPFRTFVLHIIRLVKSPLDIPRFFLLYGQKPVLPVDLELRADANTFLQEELSELDHVWRVMAELKAARLDVQLRMETVKDKQKSAYDSRHRDAQYQPDDLVLVYTPFRIVKRAEKLSSSMARTVRCGPSDDTRQLRGAAAFREG